MKLGYIFDFDGTIIDTEKYHFASWKQAFSEQGLFITSEQYDMLKSTSRENIISSVLKLNNKTQTDMAMLNQRKTELFAEERRKVTKADFTDGVLDYLVKLKSLGMKTAIASSSHNAHYFADFFDIKHLFDVILDGNFDCPQKPNPDIYFNAIKMLDLTPEQCIIFEDSVAGVKAANAGKIDVVYVGNTDCETAIMSIKNFVDLEI